jgi:UPF0176 protein
MTHAPEKLTLSFYRYVNIEDPAALMQSLRAAWEPMGVKGRTYVAHEGINAQVTVPVENKEAFCAQVRSVFPEIPFKFALEEKGEAFAKLKIKVRRKLVADGLPDGSFDVSNVGRHLDAESFHEALDQAGTIVVDLRNHYECEVGHFQGALLPEANTFRDALPEVLEKLQGQEDKKILLYCTGGIRCEKASAYFRFRGFKDVNQLHGGIIDYARQIKEKALPSRYIGKNFVFDQRLGERVTPDVIAHCHQCKTSCDEHVNCRFEGCNRLFIQCAHCKEEYEGCCSRECQDIMRLPKEERVRVQHEWEKKLGPLHYLSRTRIPQNYAEPIGRA